MIDATLKIFSCFKKYFVADEKYLQVRKDCNYSNLERVKAEAVWSDEQQRWRVPELVVQKTKLPPAGEDSSIDHLLFSYCLLFSYLLNYYSYEEVMMLLLSWKGISAFECFHSRVHSPVQSVFEEDTLFFALVVVVDIQFEIPSSATDCTVPSI